MKHIGIVLSAGSGKRIGGRIPKQYMELCGKPVLFYSLKAMQDSFIDEIILVTGAADVDFCRTEIVEKYGFAKVKAIIPGGAERYNSVYEGLKHIEDPAGCYVYIHDGARPLLSFEILENNRESVALYNAVVTAVPSKDTIKLVSPDGTVRATPDRSSVWNVQTPQTFRADLLMEAYDRMFENPDSFVTDDGMVMENYGTAKVHVCKGSYSNIKITTPEDFSVAENFIVNNE